MEERGLRGGHSCNGGLMPADTASGRLSDPEAEEGALGLIGQATCLPHEIATGHRMCILERCSL